MITIITISSTIILQLCYNLAMQRFWSKVTKTNNCWLWHSTQSRGYGQFSLGGNQVAAHRFSYELVNGPIPKPLQIDHMCRNTLCVNPEHLQAVTQKVNLLLSRESIGHVYKKQKACMRGHEYTQPNTRWYKGYRYCRACHSRRANRYYHARLKTI